MVNTNEPNADRPAERWLVVGTEDEPEAILCPCGATTDEHGGFLCWLGCVDGQPCRLLVCTRCGRLFDRFTGAVLGIAA